MKWKVAYPLVAALVGLGAWASPAAASHCGACAYPVQMGCAEQCNLPAVRYRVCYQTVVEDQKQICYRPVYRTVMKECRYTTYRPVYEQHVRDQVSRGCGRDRQPDKLPVPESRRSSLSGLSAPVGSRSSRPEAGRCRRHKGVPGRALVGCRGLVV